MSGLCELIYEMDIPYTLHTVSLVLYIVSIQVCACVHILHLCVCVCVCVLQPDELRQQCQAFHQVL